MSPLVRPDPEPVEEDKNIDQKVLEKSENFWSVLKSALGVVGRLAHAKPPKFLKEGIHSVMYGDGKGFYGGSSMGAQKKWNNGRWSYEQKRKKRQ